MAYKLALLVCLIQAAIINGNKTVAHKTEVTDFWDETEPFGQSNPSPDLRLPSHVVPSFYRLKLQADLENSNFTGEVYITIRANSPVKEIILHSKNLQINGNAQLTEQIYQKVETLHARSKRQTSDNSTLPESSEAVNNTNSTLNSSLPVPTDPTVVSNTTETLVNDTTTQNVLADNATVTEKAETSTEAETEASITPMDTQVTHSSVRNLKIVDIKEATGDRLILKLATALTPDVDYTLQLSFSGQISNALTGFYKSTYKNSNNEDKKLGVTQFEPTSARAAFPCFDEPAFKAKFEISIAHPENINVLSNMKISTEEDIPDQPGWKWTHFDRSVNMSTYLVAYILSDFKSLNTTYVSSDNVTKTIKVWARPELISKAQYALDITPKLLSFYEKVFGVPYALDKLDLIAIPDFSSGAMENWGLVTFRETTLLFDPTTGVPRDKQNVAIDVAHELAHQWFGNLVTMRWWTDLWLNEGFATYIEYLGVAHIEPKWDMFETFVRDKMDLLRSDALKNTSPVSRRVVDASEISQKFDEISYSKGANLIRMLNHTISEDLFHKGLVIYLNDWKYMNAAENDLWKAMSVATTEDPSLQKLSMVEFMNSWTRQAGYPVVNVNRNYEKGLVEIEQKLFTTASTPYQAMIDQLWQIPISYTGIAAPKAEWTTKPRVWLKERFQVVSAPVNSSEALYVNVGAIGYYRVNYDKKNWEMLSEALRSGLVTSAVTKAQLIDDAFNLAKTSQLDYSYALGLTSCVRNGEENKIVWDMLLNNMGFLKYSLKTTPGYGYFQVTKAQLIDDAFNLAKTSQLDYSYALGLTSCVRNGEENKIVWDMLLNNMGFLKYSLKTTPGYGYFQDYMRSLLQTQLKKLNYGLDKPRDDNEAILIENVLMWECYVESPRCLAWARGEFDKWMNNPTVNQIPTYLRSLVYNVALKYGGRREFDFLWDAFQNSTDPTVKSLIINNLPSTRDESLITMLLDKSINEIPKQYAVAAWSVDPPLGTAVAQQYLLANFDKVYDKFTQMDSFTFPAVLSGAFGFIIHEDDLDKLKAFASKYKQKLLPMSQTLQKLADTAALRIGWVAKHAVRINNWFKDYVTNSSTSSTANATAPLDSGNKANATDGANTDPAPAANTTDLGPNKDPNVGPNVGPNLPSNTSDSANPADVSPAENTTPANLPSSNITEAAPAV